MKNNTKKNDDAYERLANAIIIQAADDYRSALIRLKKHPRDSDARGMKMSAERFFRSEWYTQLTSVDPEMLMRKIQEEVR